VTVETDIYIYAPMKDLRAKTKVLWLYVYATLDGLVLVLNLDLNLDLGCVTIERNHRTLELIAPLGAMIRHVCHLKQGS
jgi:hypothetical protein